MGLSGQNWAIADGAYEFAMFHGSRPFVICFAFAAVRLADGVVWLVGAVRSAPVDYGAPGCQIPCFKFNIFFKYIY